MARLTSEQATTLENELISIYQANPTEPYQSALERVLERHPELRGDVSKQDLTDRIPKLRRNGTIPASPRSRARGGASARTAPQHPVAQAYQELDEAKRALDEAQRRYEKAQENLRSALKNNLPPDFLESLADERPS